MIAVSIAASGQSWGAEGGLVMKPHGYSHATIRGSFIALSPQAQSPGEQASAKAATAIAAAERLVGVRYELGADRGDAVDCSALVRRVFSSVGLRLPRTAREQMQVGKPVRVEDVSPGDILIYENNRGRGGLHAAVYIDGGKLVHASPSKRRVIVDSFRDNHVGRLIAIRRVI